MFNWRKLPHPTYGNYGGAYNKCDKSQCPLPIDWMDRAFKNHDNDLQKAAKYKKEETRKKHCKLADQKLGRVLRRGDPKKLKGWKPYRSLAKLIFKPEDSWKLTPIKKTPLGTKLKNGFKFTKKF